MASLTLNASIRKALSTYIDNPTLDNSNNLRDLFNRLDPIELIETGYSPLLDLFELTANMYFDANSVNKITSTLVSLVMCYFPQHDFLLSCPLNPNNTFIHEIVSYKQPLFLTYYFIELKTAYEQKKISQEQYSHLLIGTGANHLTPLLSILELGSLDDLKIYFSEIREALENGLVTKGQYYQLLAAPDEQGNTSFHNVLNYTQELIAFFFTWVHQTVSNNFLTERNYKDLLAIPNHANISPLQQAASIPGFDSNLIFSLKRSRSSVGVQSLFGDWIDKNSMEPSNKRRENFAAQNEAKRQRTSSTSGHGIFKKHRSQDNFSSNAWVNRRYSK